MTLADLQQAAAAAIAEYNRVAALLTGPAYTHLAPQHRANLLGKPPTWAHYVLSLGEPARGVLTKDHAIKACGGGRAMRAFALRVLEIADEVEPCPG